MNTSSQLPHQPHKHLHTPTATGKQGAGPSEQIGAPGTFRPRQIGATDPDLVTLGSHAVLAVPSLRITPWR